MSSNCIVFQHAKLMSAVNNLLLNDKRDVIKELEEFKQICRNCYTLVNALFPKHSELYKLQVSEIYIDLPILCKFFEDIKEYSKEAYEFITEGYDILNLKEFLICEKLSYRETSDTIWGIYSYSKYITYAIEKILKEKDTEKQLIMLRGLTGE